MFVFYGCEILFYDDNVLTDTTAVYTHLCMSYCAIIDDNSLILKICL